MLFACVLAIAVVPSLAFFGHWEFQISIPGTSYSLGPPTIAGDAHHTDATHDGDHENHCHERAASCSDTPLTSISWFAQLSETATSIGIESVLLMLAVACWRPGVEWISTPELPPPNRPDYLAI